MFFSVYAHICEYQCVNTGVHVPQTGMCKLENSLFQPLQYIPSLKKLNYFGDAEVVLQLRTLSAFAEDLDSVPSTHIRWS